MWFKRIFCKHEFNYLKDLHLIDNNSVDWRVECKCWKCNKVFYAHCGLALAKYGKLVQRKEV